jgi:hypothetical protein
MVLCEALHLLLLLLIYNIIISFLPHREHSVFSSEKNRLTQFRNLNLFIMRTIQNKKGTVFVRIRSPQILEPVVANI